VARGEGGEKRFTVRSRIEAIPGRLEQIWAESAATQQDPACVADAMAQKLIGRG
jgi:leucine dehydrogenase